MVEKRIDVLRSLAQQQHGYFTAAQAAQVGVSSAYLANLVRRGHFSGLAYGLYEDPTIPRDRFDRCRRALLWTGNDAAILSHKTALWVWNLVKEPTKIDLTLPSGTRIRRAGGEDYRVHKAQLPPDWVTVKDSMPTVDAAVAIIQAWHSEQVSGDDAQSLSYKGFELGVISEKERNELYGVLG